MTQQLPIFITARQVAALCGYDSAAAFLRHRARLEEDHAFPLPMPTHRSRLSWRRECVEAWVADQGRARHLPVPARPMGGNVILLAEARRP